MPRSLASFSLRSGPSRPRARRGRKTNVRLSRFGRRMSRLALNEIHTLPLPAPSSVICASPTTLQSCNPATGSTLECSVRRPLTCLITAPRWPRQSSRPRTSRDAHNAERCLHGYCARRRRRFDPRPRSGAYRESFCVRSGHPRESSVNRSAISALMTPNSRKARSKPQARHSPRRRRRVCSIVDLSGVEDPLARIDELAARCEPDVSVVAVGDRNDIILYRHLKNAGVAEYYFKPLVRDLVKRTCSSVLSGGHDQIYGFTQRQAYLRAGRARRRRSHHDRGQCRLAYGREGAALGHARRSRHAERRRGAPT